MTTNRPNILFIMADQFRHDFLGCAGADWVDTPNLDRLAARSVRFTNAFTSSPLCTPARVALATGLLPHRLGIRENDAFLPHHAPTYYRRLRNHDYQVHCVGKLDLAKPIPYNGLNGDRPCTYGWGFTHPCEVEGKMHAGSSPTPIGPYTSWLQDRGLLEAFYNDYQERCAQHWQLERPSVLPADAFADSFIGQQGATWIRNHPGDFPWHSFVSFVGPHNPFDPPQELAEPFLNTPMPEPIRDSLENKPAWQPRRAQRYARGLPNAAYAAQLYCGSIKAIDLEVGRLLNTLEERGQLDSTWIVFTADHGEMLYDHGFVDKHVPYEGAIRIPLMISGPGIAPRVDDALVELLDLAPTVCDMAEVPLLENADARSLLPLLRGETDSHRDAIVTVLREFDAIRTRTHKFVRNFGCINELYDLENDPQELVNMASDEHRLCRDLDRQLKERLNAGACLTGAP